VRFEPARDVRQQVEQARVDELDLSRAVIAQDVGDRRDRVRDDHAAFAIRADQFFPRVGVQETDDAVLRHVRGHCRTQRQRQEGEQGGAATEAQEASAIESARRSVVHAGRFLPVSRVDCASAGVV